MKKYVLLLITGFLILALFPRHALANEFQPGDQFEKPINLGEAVTIPLSQAAAYGQTASGENEQYIAITGTPAVFYAVDAETGEKKFSQALPNTDVVWAMTVGSDGNVYMAGTINGMIYRYLPNEKRLEEVGKNPSDSFVWDLKASADGKIYGSTYPRTKVFEYDIASNSFTDLGVMKEGQQYARGLGVTDQYVYVGIGTTAALVRYDRQTGEKKEIAIPNSGKGGTISESAVYNGKLFVYSGTSLFILDEATGKLIRTISFQGKISPPSPYNPNLIYYKSSGDLYSYNTETNTIQKVTGIPPLPADTAVKSHSWITLKDGQTVLTGMAAFTDSFFFNPTTNDYNLHFPTVEAQGTTVNALHYLNGKVYAGGYQRGLSIFDEKSQSYTYTYKGFHQPEGIGVMNDTLYFGTYPGAKIYRYDPSKPFDYNEIKQGNPGLILDIEEDQDRPFVLKSADNMMFIGTFPSYGKLGGALTILKEKPNSDGIIATETKTYSNIVQNQSIFGLAYKDGKLYGGTSIYGGLGSTPTEKEAKMFVFDVKTGQKIKEFTPTIPGIDVPIQLIGDLEFGPDGLLWGIVDGTIFAMNPDTLEVVKSKVVYPTTFGSSKFRPYYLKWGYDGTIYTTIGRTLTAINPVTLDSQKLITGSSQMMTLSDEVVEASINLMALSDDGSLYYTISSKLYKLPMKTIVSLSVDQQVINKYDVVNPSISFAYANGKPIVYEKEDVTLTSSDSSVLRVREDRTLQAVHSGIATVTATINRNGKVVTSNEVTITVTASLPILTEDIQKAREEEEISNSLFKRIINPLQSAQHFIDKGESDKAIHHLMKAKEVLQNTSDSELKESLRDSYIHDLDAIINSLS
ncbi:FIMAH domain-containing protein [Priestia koreensis]|uniref:FIMAH domain-containing protein n=1 Tax=Priestia koreensis TaxID=284581 RepID=UPI003CFC656F